MNEVNELAFGLIATFALIGFGGLSMAFILIRFRKRRG